MSINSFNEEVVSVVERKPTLSVLSLFRDISRLEPTLIAEVHLKILAEVLIAEVLSTLSHIERNRSYNEE